MPNSSKRCHASETCIWRIWRQRWLACASRIWKTFTMDSISHHRTLIWKWVSSVQTKWVFLDPRAANQIATMWVTSSCSTTQTRVKMMTSQSLTRTSHSIERRADLKTTRASSQSRLQIRRHQKTLPISTRPSSHLGRTTLINRYGNLLSTVSWCILLRGSCSRWDCKRR